MRLVTYVEVDTPDALPQAGVLTSDEHVTPAGPLLEEAGFAPDDAPVDVVDLLDRWDDVHPILRDADDGNVATRSLEEVRLLAPLPWPVTMRDFYAFEEHVARSWKRRGEPVPDAWYEVPVFYFTNPLSVRGPDDPILPPEGTDALDFELEVAWTVKEVLRDPTVDEATDAIAGLTILNDWSARDIQRHEMSVGLGPSKGKDFASSMGPCLVTVDELEDRRTENAYDLEMTARVNGEEVSRGNLADIHWSLGEMTAHAARDATLHPGEVLGTGTVGTGSLLDLGRDVGDYLTPGDEVTLHVEGIGVLRNVVVPRDVPTS